MCVRIRVVSVSSLSFLLCRSQLGSVCMHVHVLEVREKDCSLSLVVCAMVDFLPFPCAAFSLLLLL